MKVYFTASLRSTYEETGILDTVFDTLTNDGHKIIKRAFKVYGDLDKNYKNADKYFDLRDEELSANYKTTLRRIRDADVVITDATTRSNSVGFEIAMAQNERKPILVLVKDSGKKEDIRTASVLSGNTSKNFKLVKYSSQLEVEKAVKEFMDMARGVIDTKFILIISPEIDRYLEWTSEERRMHKAQIVRNAVEAAMAKDKEYKDFLKSID